MGVRKMKTTIRNTLLKLFFIIILTTGCQTVKLTTTKQSISKKMENAVSLYDRGDYNSAMLECIEIAKYDPLYPGLPELQSKIMAALNEQRAKANKARNANTDVTAAVDIESKKNIPETYGLRRTIKGDYSNLQTLPTRMEQALQKKVTIHLDNVNLNDFILAIGSSENINIIADKIDDSSTMTIHAEDVPLSEILDYVSRNLNVSFYAGENIMWATPRDSSEPITPMETRMYRLRKGLSSVELADSKTINIVEAINRFIPKREGADLLFDRKAHVLIAKNTRENLKRIEEIIETLDVCPPQILIEARFISTTINDLRELGIDWVLNSPYTITKKTVLQNNVPTDQPKTQIDSGAKINYAAFSGSAEGLNLSYQGILTDPMFKAVLHALETSGKTRTLSVPRVTTINNTPALIRIGEDFRYFEEYDVQSTPSSTTDAGSTVYSTLLVPVGSPKLEELGIQLNVIPSVGADMGDINLKIIPEISEFVRYEYYQVGSSGATTGTSTTNTTSLVKLPIFRRSKIETEVIVNSGETVVMGGLITSNELHKKGGIPLLRKIPLLGRFFEHDIREEDKQNLLIFVTATILSNRGESLIPIRDSDQPINE